MERRCQRLQDRSVQTTCQIMHTALEPLPTPSDWVRLVFAGDPVRALEPCAQVHYAVSLQVCTLDAIPYMICIAKAL